NEVYQLTVGTALRIEVTLRDANGGVIGTLSGTEPLTTTVWAGGTRAPAFTATTTWHNASAGEILIQIADSDTANLAPGRYQLLARLGASGSAVDAYGCVLDILPFAGDEDEPTVYTTYDDLLRYGRSWLRQLQTVDDEAGFAEQQHGARTWIED